MPKSISIGAQYVIDPPQYKMDEKKIQHVPEFLTQENGFGSASCGQYEAQQRCAPPKKSVINCDLTAAAAAQCFLETAHHNDWSRWFAISSPPTYFALPSFSFSFIGGVAKELCKRVHN